MAPGTALPDSAEVYSQAVPYQNGTLTMMLSQNKPNRVCFSHPVVQKWQQQASVVSATVLLRAPNGVELLWKQEFSPLSPNLMRDGELCLPLKYSLDEGIVEMVVADKRGNVLARKFMRVQMKGHLLEERKVSEVTYIEQMCVRDAKNWHFSVYSDGLPLPIYNYQHQALTLVSADSLLVPSGAGDPDCYTVATQGVLFADDSASIPSKVVVGNEFPSVQTPSMLINSLRYLWFDSSSVSQSWRDQKYLVDSFWLSLGTHQEQARKLLQAYYRRVEFANNQFTDWRPGYLTDRGEVYILLGPPDALYVTMDTERWVYYPEGNGPGEQLVFRYNAAKPQPRGWSLEWKPHYASLLAWGREKWLRGKILFFQVQD